MSKTIEAKVLEVRRFNSKRPESYKEQEVLTVEDAGGHKFTLSRFRRANEDALYPNGYYKGEQKKTTRINPKTKVPYDDTFEDVVAIEGFGGVETPFDPARKGNGDPADERQKSILTQSDILRASTLTVAYYSTRPPDEYPDVNKDDVFETMEYYYKEIKAFREAEMEK